MTRSGQHEDTTRVLIVEDNPGDADLVRLALEEDDAAAFDIDEVARLSAALARLRETTAPDVVLLDVTLPDASGLDGVHALRKAAPEVPIVVHTGSNDRALGPAAIQAGAQDYLIKGSDAGLLRRALRYAVDRHEHATQARLLGEERAARAAAEAARERMSVLATASTAIAHSLDDRHAFTSLVSVLASRFADWCMIGLVSPECEAPELIWSAAGAEPGGAPAELAALWARDQGSSGPRAVVSTGRPELYEDVAAGSAGSPWQNALQRMGVRSAMVVPIRLRDEVLGAIALAARRRRYGADDLAVAEEIGRNAAIALANCRLYREMRLAAAAREEFLSVAAHELRTPLTVLQLKTEQVALKQQSSICATCQHAVPADHAGTARQITRLAQLVESLLDVSRIIGERVTLEREPLDLHEVVREAIDRMAALVNRSQSQVQLRCDAPVRGSWDRLALERIVAHLLSNALKFGGGKPVEVRVGTEGDDAVLEVQDHGIGIAHGDVDRIFGQFERAVSSRHYGGLGLGLYITHRLIEAHGGTIEIVSREGSGALFRVRLPREIT